MPDFNTVKDFRLLPASFGSQLVDTYLNTKNLGIDMGFVMDAIIDRLITTQFKFNRQFFTLVNVFNPTTFTSVGIINDIPENAYFKNQVLVLSFALDGRANLQDRIKPVAKAKRAWRRNRFTVVWDVEYKKRKANSVEKILTIGFTAAQLKNIGVIKQGLINNLSYLYSVIGLVTKNWAVMKNRFKRAQTSSETYDLYYKESSLEDMATRVKEKDIHSLVNTVPYPLWVFNKHIWRKYPNLISDRMISKYTTLYYLIFLHKIVKNKLLLYRANLHLDTKDRIGLNMNVKTSSILKHIRDSVMMVPFFLEKRDISYPVSLTYVAVNEYNPSALPLLYNNEDMSLETYKEAVIDAYYTTKEEFDPVSLVLKEQDVNTNIYNLLWK